MAKRGKVLRDTSAGPGLLMVEGQQYQFTLEGIWKSEVAPKPGQVVDVEFDAGGQITGITAVPDNQLAKEQAEAAMAVAKEKGAALASGVVAKVGLPNLIAGAALILGWFVLSTVTVEAGFLGKMQFTFWQILGFLNSNNILEALGAGGHPSAGMYGLFCIVCLAGPFVGYFWKDKRAHLGGVLPLLFMIIVGLVVRSSINSAFGPAASGPYAEMQERAQEEAMKALSMGMGAYLALFASLYFAGVGTKNFLAAKGTEAPVYAKPKAA